MRDPSRHFALSISRSSSPDRDLIEGVASFAEQHQACKFHLIPPEILEREIRQKEFDGLICRLLDERIDRCRRQLRIPTVDLLNAMQCPDVAVVCPDNESIGTMAAEHFLDRGFEHFAFFGYKHVTYSDERRNGFVSALKQHGLSAISYETSVRPWQKFGHVTTPGYSIRTSSDEKALVKNLLEAPKPLAAFCCHDPRAACLIEACHKVGLSIPKDVAVLGVDNDSVYCSFSSPRLSSIELNAKAIGYEAARLICDISILPRKRQLNEFIRMPPQSICIRESSETYPIKPNWMSDALVFIRQNATSGISALDVFNHIGHSRALIQATFRKIRHTSVQKEIIATRMLAARRILETTTLSIAEISAATGFASPRYFCQAFNHLYGQSPTDWRRGGSRVSEPRRRGARPPR